MPDIELPAGTIHYENTGGDGPTSRHVVLLAGGALWLEPDDQTARA